MDTGGVGKIADQQEKLPKEKYLLWIRSKMTFKGPFQTKCHIVKRFFHERHTLVGCNLMVWFIVCCVVVGS